MIRSIVERLFRDTRFRRRLPAQFGRRPIYLSADSALMYLKPRWALACAPLFRAASHYAAGAKCVWDIGSNCGVFALAAAHVTGPDSDVLAVEPDPFLAALLQQSISHCENQDRVIHLLSTAVSDRQGVAKFLIARRGRSSNCLEDHAHCRSQSGGVRRVQYVPTTTLDSLLEDFKPPDMIKIDVEGAELRVLRGARTILADVRPRLYVEVGTEDRRAVTQELLSHNYRLFNGDGDCRIPIACCVANTLALPAEAGPLPIQKG